MNIHRQIVVFDTPDLDGEAGFWVRLLGGEVTDTEDADWRTVRVDGEPRLGFRTIKIGIPVQIEASCAPHPCIPSQIKALE